MKDTDFNQIDSNNENCTKETYYPIKISVNGRAETLDYKRYMELRKSINKKWENELSFEQIGALVGIGYTAIFRIEPRLYEFQGVEIKKSKPKRKKPAPPTEAGQSILKRLDSGVGFV